MSSLWITVKSKIGANKKEHKFLRRFGQTSTQIEIAIDLYEKKVIDDVKCSQE